MRGAASGSIDAFAAGPVIVTAGGASSADGAAGCWGGGRGASAAALALDRHGSRVGLPGGVHGHDQRASGSCRRRRLDRGRVGRAVASSAVVASVEEVDRVDVEVVGGGRASPVRRSRADATVPSAGDDPCDLRRGIRLRGRDRRRAVGGGRVFVLSTAAPFTRSPAAGEPVTAGETSGHSGSAASEVGPSGLPHQLPSARNGAGRVASSGRPRCGRRSRCPAGRCSSLGLPAASASASSTPAALRSSAVLRWSLIRLPLTAPCRALARAARRRCARRRSAAPRRGARCRSRWRSSAGSAQPM